MKYRAYPEYKDSGVEWLGKVPDHWEVRRLKFVAELIKDKVEPNKANQTYIGLENVQSETGRFLPSEASVEPESLCIQFNSNSVLFGKLRPYLAKVLEPESEGICSSEFLVLQPNNIIRKLLKYQLLSEWFIKVVDSSTYGAKMPRASWDFIGSMPSLIGPQLEQTQITTFLDRETQKIDTLIEKQERLIEMLQEKRQAVISPAVTKGLDPNVKMKDSGVEWLGEVPEHWDMMPLKYASTFNDEVLPDTTALETELLYVDIGGVEDGKGITSYETLYFADAPSRARRIVKDGDVIISTVRTYLRAIAPIKDLPKNVIVSTGFAVIRPKNIFYSGFAAYSLRSEYFVGNVVADSVGVSYPAINSSDLVFINIPIPPISEQTKIASFLDRETQKIDNLVTKAENSITLLKEHRTALISAAVTGKIDVRPYALYTASELRSSETAIVGNS